jgi:soluble lytic murein transglycosylase-like protein
VKEYNGNVGLALLVYNRGPVAVQKARAEGDNPSNGYDRILTKGYRGKGTVE